MAEPSDEAWARFGVLAAQVLRDVAERRAEREEREAA